MRRLLPVLALAAALTASSALPALADQGSSAACYGLALAAFSHSGTDATHASNLSSGSSAASGCLTYNPPPPLP